MPKRPLTPEDLKKIVFVADPQISPDGSRILFTRKHINEKNKYITNLWSVDLEGHLHQLTQGESAGNGRFAPDGNSIAFISGREKPSSQIYILPLGGGEARKLTNLPEGSLGSMEWSPNGKFLAFKFRPVGEEWTEQAKKHREEHGLSTPPRVIDDHWYRLDGDGYFLGQRHALYIIPAEGGDSRLLFQGGRLDDFDFGWSPDSNEVVVTASVAKNPLADEDFDQLFRIDLDGNQWQLEGLPKGSKSAPKFSPDGNWIAYAGRDHASGSWGYLNTHLYVCPAGGGASKDITEQDDYCMAAAMLGDSKEAAFGAVYEWAPDSKSLFCQVGWHGEQHLGRVDIANGKVQLLTSGETGINVGGFSRDGKTVACTYGDATRLTEIAIIDAESGNVQRLTHFNKEYHEEIEVSEPECVWLDSPDGWKVQAWVIKPINYREPKRYPAILQVHGGPHTQYGYSYFHEFQVLAAAGYVVVYSNPRGSKGYGEAHTSAIAGSWGDRDWVDIETVTRWMQHQPYIHPGQIGIMGGSYGGYMTNWAVGHSKDYKAAITDRCVSNLVSQAMNSDFPNRPDSYWKGTPWSGLESIAELWKQSPIAYFDRVDTPMLVLHSEGDLRCNIEQSESVFSALQQRGIPSRFVRYPQSTFHGMSRSGPPDLRIHRLGEILEWWKKYLG